MCFQNACSYDWSRIAVMPVEASASSSNVLYASVMLFAVYSMLSPSVLLTIGSSSATSAKWLAKNVTDILTGFFVLRSFVLWFSKFVTALSTDALSSFSIRVMPKLLAETLPSECLRARVSIQGAYFCMSSVMSWASPATIMTGTPSSPAT